jgi:dTDP-4-dehydrorhamnose reductase
MLTDNTRKEVAIVGGTSWIGQLLCAELVRRGFQVYVATRSGNAFLLERSGANIIEANTIGAGFKKQFGTVINLAFPAATKPGKEVEANRRILDSVEQLLGKGGHLVQVSTVAVFGLPVCLPISTELLQPRRDSQYVMSKVQMENWVADLAGFHKVDIVRLGNVWGPASDNWVVGVAERLRSGLALGVLGNDGYSNVTDVANVVDYICFLVESVQIASEKVRIHHLAEFSSTPWSVFVNHISKELDIPVNRCCEAPFVSNSASEEFKIFLKRIIIKEFQESIRNAKYCGSYYRQIRNACPQWLFQIGAKMKKSVSSSIFTVRNPKGATDDILLLMSNATEFKSAVDRSWCPPVTLDESLKRVSQWLLVSGYKSI